jgi:hypothetical protein
MSYTGWHCIDRASWSRRALVRGIARGDRCHGRGIGGRNLSLRCGSALLRARGSNRRRVERSLRGAAGRSGSAGFNRPRRSTVGQVVEPRHRRSPRRPGGRRVAEREVAAGLHAAELRACVALRRQVEDG